MYKIQYKMHEAQHGVLIEGGAWGQSTNNNCVCVISHATWCGVNNIFLGKEGICKLCMHSQVPLQSTSPPSFTTNMPCTIKTNA